jgi:hypothetical protein
MCVLSGKKHTGFYEDLDEPEALEQLGKYTATYIVTRAVKL